MSWWKNGLLLGVGGIAGLALAAWLESEGKFDDDLFRVPRDSRRELNSSGANYALLELLK